MFDNIYIYMFKYACKTLLSFLGTELGGEVVHSSMYQHLWTNAPKVSVLRNSF